MGNTQTFKSHPDGYDDTKTLHITIKYGKAEGDEYADHYRNLAAFLVKQPSIADRVQVIGHQDKTASGRFEVVIEERHETIHSKKDGMGFPKDEDRSVLLEKIEKALEVYDKIEAQGGGTCRR